MSDCYPVEPDLRTLLESEARLIAELRGMTAERNILKAENERLRGLCNWAAGRMLDAGDIAGHEEVLRKLGQGT